ncbi:MAG TPA: non-homologous end-joining DNA ligase [Nocardioidaceae bacterium]|nr:non-homologous end-joining DNA ligase [Nocardioidaceae bacterium]
MRPMLATKGTSVPVGAGWVHEVKWDGMRVIAEVRDGVLRLWSRNENDVTVSFPELHDVGVLAAHDVLLDGEVVAMADGIPTFAALADRMHVSSAGRARALARSNPVTLLVFDVLALDGRDLRGEPWEVRRGALQSLDIGSAHWQVPPVYDDGAMLKEATEQQGLEGIVSKKRSSTYQEGRRSKDWLKFPHRATLSYVVGGWRHETDSESRLGAVLVGAPGPEGLSYRGRVGSGITGKAAQRLLEVLEPLQTDSSPFCDEVPRVDALGTVWVRPEVVVEVAALGLTNGGRLRQPSYQGVRFDLAPADLGE